MVWWMLVFSALTALTDAAAVGVERAQATPDGRLFFNSVNGTLVPIGSGGVGIGGGGGGALVVVAIVIGAIYLFFLLSALKVGAGYGSGVGYGGLLAPWLAPYGGAPGAGVGVSGGSFYQPPLSGAQTPTQTYAYEPYNKLTYISRYVLLVCFFKAPFSLMVKRKGRWTIWDYPT